MFGYKYNSFNISYQVDVSEFIDMDNTMYLPIVTGNVAEEDDVPKAVANALLIFLIKWNGSDLVIALYKIGKSKSPWILNPRTTVAKNQPNLPKFSATSFIPITSPATRKQTPTGAKWMIQLVIFIIISTKLVKKFSTGFPSSPLIAIAIPKAKLKAMRPRKN